MKANRKVKDSVFSLYFTEDTKRLIEVYNALNGTDFPMDTPVEVNTLQDALYKDRVNDVSFLLDDRFVVLLEHQSTINENMPLRMAIYLGRLYEKIFASEKYMYRTKKVEVPFPDFYVLYNGRQETPLEDVLWLSDSFRKPFPKKHADLPVTFVNIRNPDADVPALQKSRSLREYSIFVNYVYAYQEKGFSLEDAIHQAVLECKRLDVMQPFLTNHASEVENMLFSEWSLDDAIRYAQEESRAEGREEGLTEGREEGRAEGKLETLKSFLGLLPDEVIAEKAEVPLSTIAELRKTIPQET